MPQYYFHLVGDISAHDILGHECADDDEARADARAIAHQIGTQRPAMVREENYVSIMKEDDTEVGQVKVASYKS
jgi:hypothetical protein